MHCVNYFPVSTHLVCFLLNTVLSTDLGNFVGKGINLKKLFFLMWSYI